MKKIIQHLQSDTNEVEETPLSEYPRPQLKRASYLCLNGKWDFAISSSLPTNYDYQIIVPYALESQLSCVQRKLEKDEKLFYRKLFKLPSDFIKEHIILHFDAVDQIADVFLNGKLVIHHEGGYLPFAVDIAAYLKEENELIVQVKDELEHQYGYGKQSLKSHGMWYTKSSGIWKSVWLEATPKKYIEYLKIDSTLDSVSIKVFGGDENKTLILHEKEDKIYRFSDSTIEIKIDNPHLWSPDDPYLYHFTLKSGEDEVQSYFALRTIEIKNANEHQHIFLNNKPYFFHGVLDQGYFCDGLLTPKSYQKYEDDILLLKKLGFNTLRKHIKIEPLYFYYLCDKLGMIVFQDFVNNGNYSFFKDTLLPTIGLKKWKHKGKHTKKEVKDKFIDEAKGTLSLLHNSPSVCYYTIFNEGWGQFNADEMYKLFKEEEPHRIIDTTSGWFYGKDSDVDSHHIYFKIKKMPYKSRPIILSEFGGYVYKIPKHSYCLNKTYGYRIFSKYEDLQKALITLYQKQVIPYISKGLSGAIYTQLSDVEEETNGLVTYDRKAVKVEQTTMDTILALINAEVAKLRNN